MSDIRTVDVGAEFYPRLRNRNKMQGDGTHTAIEFRDTYLSEFYSQEAWKDNAPGIILDFGKVTRLGPSFANEAFAYFARLKGVTLDKILSKFVFKNISKIKMGIIKVEIEHGYRQ